MDTSLKQLATHFAKLYIHIAREVESRFGNEGKNAIREGIRNFSFERGKNIRKIVQSKNLPLNMDNYYGNFDNSLAEAGFNMNLDLRDWQAEGIVSHCPFAEIWKEMGEEDLGRIYCEVDHDMLKGYNPELKLERPENILDGSKKCVFHWTKREHNND